MAARKWGHAGRSCSRGTNSSSHSQRVVQPRAAAPPAIGWHSQPRGSKQHCRSYHDFCVPARVLRSHRFVSDGLHRTCWRFLGGDDDELRAISSTFIGSPLLLPAYLPAPFAFPGREGDRRGELPGARWDPALCLPAARMWRSGARGTLEPHLRHLLTCSVPLPTVRRLVPLYNM